MTYQLSLKVEREYIIASSFTDDASLGIRTIATVIDAITAPPFTDDELPTFTEGRKKITNIEVHCRCPTNFH